VFTLYDPILFTVILNTIKIMKVAELSELKIIDDKLKKTHSNPNNNTHR
jgi:hypothetical protein